jgi:hypothetical protein
MAGKSNAVTITGRMHTTRGMVINTGIRMAFSSALIKRVSRHFRGKSTQGLGNAGTESFRLNQKRDKRPDGADAGAFRHGAKGVRPGPARAQLLGYTLDLPEISGMDSAISCPTRTNDASRLRPASTQTTIKSSASGNWISSWVCRLEANAPKIRLGA